MGTADSMIQAFQAGRQMRQQQEDQRTEAEERKLRQDVLRHQLVTMKLEDRLRASTANRTGALENARMLEGRPEAQMPPDVLGGMPATDLSQVVSNFPGQGGASTPVAANQPLPTRGIPIPGINVPEAGYNIPGTQVVPQTLEQQIAARLAEARLKRMATPQRPVVVPTGGTAVDPDTGEVIARGAPRTLSPEGAAADARARDREKRLDERAEAKEKAEAARIKRVAAARKSAALAQLEKEFRTVKVINGERQPPMSQEVLDAEKLRIQNAYLEEIGEGPDAELGRGWGGGTPAPGANQPPATPAATPAATPRVAPKVGERRRFGKAIGEWDGKGWRTVG